MRKVALSDGTSTGLHFSNTPSPWVLRWAAALLPPNARVLDVACGWGRHSHALARLGYSVTALDRDSVAMEHVAQHWPTDAPPPEALITADIEQGPWPLPDQQFDAVVITHYLWRPLWPTFKAALKPGGCYIHETFTHGQGHIGKPVRPEFLLETGELLQVCQDWRIVAYEDGFATTPNRYIQRIAAVVPSNHPTTHPISSLAEMPPRYRL